MEEHEGILSKEDEVIEDSLQDLVSDKVLKQTKGVRTVFRADKSQAVSTFKRVDNYIQKFDQRK